MYDAKQIQGKNVTAEELCAARDDLYSHLGNNSKALCSVTLELDRDFDHFSAHEEQEFLKTIQDLLKKSDDIRVIKKRRGSVKLTVQLNADETKRLISAIESGVLDRTGVRIINVDPFPSRSGEAGFSGLYSIDGITDIAVPRPQAIDTIRHADAQQHLRRARDVAFDDSVCSVFCKQFGNSGNMYTVLVATYNLEHPLSVFAALRVYASEIHHSTSWTPLNILRGFLNKYGVDIGAPGQDPTRLLQNYYLRLPEWITSSSEDDFIRDSLVPMNYPSDIGWMDKCLAMERHKVVHAVRIELAFAFDRRTYGLDLRRHGVKVPPTSIPDGPTAHRNIRWPKF